MKWRVTWWIHGAGAICRGHDVIDGSEDFDEDDAEELIEKDLERNLSSSLTKYSFPSPFEPVMPKFYEKHSDLTIASRHSEISNWGVLRVMPLKETTMKKPVRRWRLWRCVQGSAAHRAVRATEEIAWLDLKGFKAKIHAPLPRHKTSGHTHIVVLATLDELLSLAGVAFHYVLGELGKVAVSIRERIVEYLDGDEVLANGVVALLVEDSMEKGEQKND